MAGHALWNGLRRAHARPRHRRRRVRRSEAAAARRWPRQGDQEFQARGERAKRDRRLAERQELCEVRARRRREQVREVVPATELAARGPGREVCSRTYARDYGLHGIAASGPNYAECHGVYYHVRIVGCIT